MANHNAKVQPVRSKPIRTTWLKNALSAVGSTSKSVLKEYAPTISGAVDSGADLVRTMRTSVIGTRRGTSGTNLTQNKYVKLANTAFKNALDDIKSGHLAGNDERAMQDMMGDGGFNDLFDESSGGVTFGDSNDSGGGVTMNYVNAAGSAEAFTSLSSSINKQTELTLRTAKAQTDAFVSLTSAQFFQNQQMGTQILSHLGAIEKNLASLVEYNNSNMNKFIESSIAYYDKMGQATLGKKGKKDDEPDDGDIGNVIGSNGGFDFGAYKKYVKSRLKTSLSNSEFKMLADMMDENTLQMLASNPLGMGATMFAQWAMPEVLSTTIKGLDSAIASMMPSLMKRMTEWGERQSNTIFGKITGTIAKSMGLDQDRLNYIDKEKDIKLNLDAIPFDGETKLAITNTITKQLSDQTMYLKFIAENMNAGGLTGGSQIEKNRASLTEMQGQRTRFNLKTKSWETMQEHDDNLLKDIVNSIADGFNNTDFGRKITANINDQSDETAKKQLQEMQKQLYVFLNTMSKNNTVDFTSHNGRVTSDLKAAIKGFIPKDGDSGIANTFINILDQIATNDPIAFNSFMTGQIRSNATRNAKIKSMRENPTRSGILETDMFNRKVKDKDGKEQTISIDQLLEELMKRSAEKNLSGKATFGEVNDRRATENDPFANGDTMKFMDILRNSSMRTLNNVGSAFMNNDPKALMASVTSMFSDAATTVANAFNDKFFKPMHDKIFGVKDENGFSRGGAISDMKNTLHDSFLEMQHRLTGKAYKDSSGQQHDKSENSVFGNIKEGIMEKIFGKKQVDENGNPTGKRERSGIFSQVTDGIKESFANWHNAMFGEFAKDGKKVDKDNVVKVMQNSLKEKLPNAMLGGVAGGAAGLASGGLLGAMIGGPIGGVVLGTAVGFASKSEKFQKLIFGDEDKDNGLITKKTQKFIKDNKTALIGGAAIGGLKGTLLGGGGFLGTLVGGPVAGALLGMATTTALKSKTFHEFLFGNEEKGRLGVLKSFKNVIRHNKERSGESAGLSLSGKALGMGAVGAGAGALTASLLSQIGFMPAMLTAGGPVGGAILGLGLAIKAQSDTFSRWLFGNRKKKDDPDYQAGVLGQLGNALQVYVLQPFKHTTEEIAADIGFTFKHDVLGTVEAAIEPVGNALSDIAYSIKKKAAKITNKIGEVFVDRIADPFVNVLTNTVLKPFTTLGKNVAKLTYAVTKQVALLPFRALDTVTHIIVSPVTQVVRKVFHPIKGVKWLMHTVANAFELATGKSLDPVRNVMDGAAKILKKAISSPFTLLKFLFKGVGKVGEKIGDAANFIDDLGEGSALKRMEKGGLFDEKSLKQKYNADVQKNGKTMEYDEWKDKYIKSKDRTGYNYLEKLKQRYEKEKEKGNIPIVNGEPQSFEAWKDDYMRQDLSGRLKARKDERKADKAELQMKKVRNRQNEWNIRKINKLTGGNVWEDTVDNRARAEAMSGKKIRWRGKAIDEDVTKNAASMDADQIARGDQKKMSNDVRKISLLQQILNVLMHKNPDGTDPNKVNKPDPERERLKNGTSDTGEEDAKENKEDSSSKVDPNAHSRMSSAQFMTGSKMKNWSIGRRYLQANHMVPDEDAERMSDREVQDTLKKYGVDSQTLSEFAKKTGAGSKVERAIYSIFGKLSGKGYEDGTENAKEGYSIVGEAGRPEIVWTNKGDKVYSDRRKPIRVEIAGYARDAVSKFVKYIRGAAKSLANGGEADDGVGGARISDARAAANAYSQIDDGEAAENNEQPALPGPIGGAQLALPMKDSGEGSQTDTQLPAVIENGQMAIVKQKQETREKAMDAAKTAEELQAEHEAEKQKSLGNRLLEGIKNIASNTGAQLSKSTGFFTDWLKMFGKKGLIGAGIIAGIAFLTKTGLLKKLADFLGNVGELIPAIAGQISKDTAWQNDNRANTNGQDAEGELEDTVDSFKDLGKGNILGFLTGRNGKADHMTAAKAKFLRNAIKKPVKYGIKIGKGIYKGGKALVKGGKNIANAVKTGITDFRHRKVPKILSANGVENTATAGSVKASKGFTDTIGDYMVDYGDDAVLDASLTSTDTASKFADSVGGSMVDYSDDMLNATLTGADDVAPSLLSGEGADIATDAVFNTSADTIAEHADDVVASGIKSSGDKMAEGAAKVTMESAGESAEKGTEKMGKKILNMVQKFFTKVADKIGNSKWVTKIMEKLSKSKAFLDKTILGKLVKKATAFLGKHLGAAAATLGTSELAGIALGALNGLTGTARLFQVNKDQVDGTMKLISFAMGAFTGSTVGGIVDIVNEITASMCGFDLLNVAACSAYKLIAGDTKYDKLMDSRDAFKEEYIADRNKDLKKQYSVLDKAGLADKWGSEDAYIEAVNKGEVNGNYKSFQDYNSDENASLMERGTKAITNGASKLLSGGKKLLFGEDGEEGYIGATGNRYVKDKDGTFTVYDKDGNPLGKVGDETNFQDDIVDSFKNDKKSKGIVGTVLGMGKPLKDMAKKVGQGIKSVVSSMGKNASRFASAAVKLPGKIWNFFTDRGTQEQGWELRDGTGAWYDNKGQLHNANGDEIGEPITQEELSDLIRTNTVKSVMWHDRTGWEKFKDSAGEKIREVGAKVWDKAVEVKDTVVKGLQDFGSAALKTAKTAGGVIAAAPAAATLFFTSHNAKKYMCQDGTYYMQKSMNMLAGATGSKSGKAAAEGWYHYSMTGELLSDEPLTPEEMQALVVSNGLTEVDIRTSGLQEVIQHKIVPGFKGAIDNVKTAFSNGYEAVKGTLDKGLTAAGATLAKMGRSVDRALDHAHDFIFGGTQVRWVNQVGTYYIKNDDGKGYAKYSVNGTLINENVDRETVEAMIDSGMLTKQEVKEDNIIKKATDGLADIGGKIGDAFMSGCEKLGTLVTTGLDHIGTFFESVNKYGWITTLTSPFKESKTVGYYEPTGNYYKREGSTFTYYSQNGDILKKNVDAAEIDEKLQAGLLTTHEIVEDSKAKQAITKIQESAKKAWDKAGSIVKSGWEKFTNWIMGGSGSGTVESKKSYGTGGGFGIAGLSDDDYGTLPMFADTSAVGGGFGTSNASKKHRKRGGGFGRKTAAPDKVNGHSYYSQADTRWASNKYEYNNDGGTLGNSGCGPAAMSMVVSDMTGNAVDPTQMAALAQKTGTRDNTGTNWNFVSGAATTFGLDSEQRYAPNANFIHDSLKSGNEVVLSGTSTGTGTPYTAAGHYVVAVGEDANGRIRVNDPRGKAYSRSYKPEELTKYTGSAWSIGNGGYGIGGRRRLILPFGGYGKTRDGKKPIPKRLQNGNSNAPKNASTGNDRLDSQSTVSTSSSNAVGSATGEDILNGFPFLMQTDSRWSDTVYTSVGDNSQTIGTSGCGPTSMAMILRSYGANVTPVDTCKFSTDNGYRTANDGTSWDFFSAIGKKYGVDTESLGLDGSKLTNSLSNKKPVIASMGPSTFTKGGHFIALVGLKDGKVVVNDPASQARSETTYDPSVFTSEGHNFWSFSKNGKGSIGDLSSISSTESIPGASTATTTDTMTSETDVISKIGNVFSLLGSKALEGALTGNWNMDFTQQSASTSTSSATSSIMGSTSLTGNENTEKIYNYLVGTAGLTPYGAAGLMGNLEAESGMDPTNVENILESKLGLNDAQYTADVDSGKISKNDFLHPLGKQYGYGLAQWTSPNRKEGLYDLVKSKNVSIGDLGTQLEWLMKELQGSYSSVYNTLKSASSVQDASNAVLHKFEAPADQSTPVENTRAAKGMNWYNKYAAASGSKGGFGVRFLRAMNKLTGGRGMNKLLNRMRGGKGGSAADAREAIVGWMLCLIGQNTYTQSGDRSRVMEGVDGHGYGDCSSTCCKIYETAVGKVIGSYTGDMIDAGTVVDGPNTKTDTYPDESKMLPGDLIFYYSHGASGESGHVEMYIGNGQLAGHGSGIGPKIHEMKGYQDNRLSWGGGTWIQVVRYLDENATYNVNAPDKSKYKVQNTFTDGKGKSANGANTGSTSSITGNAASTDAGTASTSNSIIDRMGTVYSALGTRAMEGTLTGNWNTDFSSLFSSGSSSSTTGATPSTGTSSGGSLLNGNYPTYTLTDAQKKYIARTITRENGGDDYSTNLDSASHMVNLNEVQMNNPTTGDALYKMVQTSGWYGHYGDDDFPAYAMNPPQAVYDAIDQVMGKGKRTLPRYVTEYDMFPLDAAIAGHWGNGSSEDRSQYVKHKTLITQNSSRGLNAKYTFYKFFGDKGDGDVSGYYEQYYQKYKDEDPRPDGVTPEAGGSGIGTSHLADPKVLHKIAILRAQGDTSANAVRVRNYKPTREIQSARAITRAQRREERSQAYQQALDLQNQRKAGGRGAYVNTDNYTSTTGYNSVSSITEIMSRADAAKSSGNDTELLRCMLEILAIIAENTGKSASGLSQATELLANLKTGNNVVVTGNGGSTGTVQTLKSEGSKPTRNAQLAKKIAAGK